MKLVEYYGKQRVAILLYRGVPVWIIGLRWWAEANKRKQTIL